MNPPHGHMCVRARAPAWRVRESTRARAQVAPTANLNQLPNVSRFGKELVAQLRRSLPIPDGAKLFDAHGRGGMHCLPDNRSHRLLDVVTRIIEMHEQPAQEVLIVSLV
mmetsp:Transcript_4398/g.9504  ORF Transcript_4398/g.9504 Transcript_4398/m.9504 type:complete len:109 (-) Transcript_4398:565-891(-)